MRITIISLLIALSVACTNKTYKEPDLVAYWSFDDTTSANIDESTGSGLITINKGAKQVDGYRGKAMEFDGNSVMEVEYNTVLDSFSKGMTVAAWIKKDTASHWNTIISREIDSTWSEYMGLAIFKNHALFSIDPDGKRYINTMDTNSVVPYKWMHIAGTYDNDTLKLYIDGRLIRFEVSEGPFKFHDKNPMLIGGNSNNKNISILDCFVGYIDEVRIYKRALSIKEINALIKN
jgi:hypothetical protein